MNKIQLHDKMIYDGQDSYHINCTIGLSNGVPFHTAFKFKEIERTWMKEDGDTERSKQICDWCDSLEEEIKRDYPQYVGIEYRICW